MRSQQETWLHHQGTFQGHIAPPACVDRPGGNGAVVQTECVEGDGAKAAGVVQVALADLRRGFSARLGSEDVRHAQALVETFEKVPPIVVHRQTMNVIDGNHRVLAARMLELTSVAAVFFDGDAEQAYVEAVRYNIAHGRPLTMRERERAAAHIIAQHSDWSDRRISEVCGLSPKTVGRLRPPSTAPNPQLSRVGRDGKRRPTDPASARLRIAKLFAERPDSPPHDIARQTGSSEATVRDVRQRLRDGRSPIPHPNAAGCRADLSSGIADGSDRKMCWSEDTALRSTPSGHAFAQWLDSSTVGDADWASSIEALPLSRLPLIADEARRRGESWARLADTLDSRLRKSPRL